MSFEAKLERILLNPLIGGATAVMTVMAGAFASFFQKDIESNLIPWPWIDFATISVKATAFWFSVFTVGFLLAGAQWATRRQSDRAQESAQAQARSLSESVSRIESLPPEDFLARYQTLMRSAARSAVVGLGANGDVSVIDPAIRNILTAILELARVYDLGAAGTTYAANIMLFSTSGPREAVNPVGFVEDVAGNPEFVGVLEVVRSLSTSAPPTDSQPDQGVPELVIPIPLDTAATRGPDLVDLHPVLPGAAWAFVYQEFAGFATISKVDEWLSQRSSAPAERVELVRRYFRAGGGGEKIGSFASRPLLAPGADTDTEPPLGVLNLHSDRPGLLAERGGDRFSPLLEPFCMMLSILLVSRRVPVAPAGGNQNGQAAEHDPKGADPGADAGGRSQGH